MSDRQKRKNGMIGVLMRRHRVCSAITQFVSQQCKSVERRLCICLFKLVCLREGGARWFVCLGFRSLLDVAGKTNYVLTFLRSFVFLG